MSVSPVSITCFRKPTTGIGSICSRTPLSITYGKSSSPVVSSYIEMLTTWASKTSRILSPTWS